MEATGSDMTNSFRVLSQIPLPGTANYQTKNNEIKRQLLAQCCTLAELRKASAPKMDPRQDEEEFIN